jgi:Flp pilus assembly pilin Flp
MNKSTSIRIQSSGVLTRIRAALGALSRDRVGATTVEYIVLVAFIALGGIAAVSNLGARISEATGKAAKGVTEFKEAEGVTQQAR